MTVRHLAVFVALHLVLSTRYSVICAADTPRRITDPKDILERFDIGESQFEEFVSGRPLSSGEEDTLVKILYAFPRLGLENLHRWRQRDFGWYQLVAAPRDHRASVFRVGGRATHVETVRLPREQAQLVEFDHYYRVRVALSDARYEAIVSTRRIPAAWDPSGPIDEPMEADGLFLKLGDIAADPPELLFVTERLGWYPDELKQTHHIGPPQIQLAKLGMDVSLWEDVRQSKERGLGAADREAFYHLLAALGRPEADDLKQVAAPLNLVALLEKPADHFGDVSPLQGLARRVMKVPVSDSDIRVRFGIDHYYEIDLFLPLEGAALRFGNDPSGEKNPVYRNKFPATLIVRELPPGFPQGETLHELVAADGVFFKIWNYRSQYTGQFQQLQPAPLFIAPTARLVVVPTAQNWITSGLVLTALGVALGVVIIVAWVYGCEDKKAQQNRKRNSIGDSPPDFSRLS